MVLRDADIRPTEFEIGKLKALDADIHRLLQRKGDFVRVTCPACGRPESEFEFDKFGFRFEKCASCRTVYMNPRATEEILAEFYGQSVLYEYWNRYIFPASRQVRMERIFRPRVQRILELAKGEGIEQGVLLEIGAAAGMFCEEALASGGFKRVIGIEPGAAQAATCRELGIEIIEAPIEQVESLDIPADIVASFETLEHVHSPRHFLESCYRLLAQRGLLVITCPNYEGFDITTLGARSDSLDAEHINMFNPESLSLLVQSIGFEVVEVSTPGELDAELVRKKAQDGSIDLSDQPLLKRILLTDWESYGRPFQNFLKTQRLSSHMWLVARKIK